MLFASSMMAGIKAKALFDFSSDVTGELSFYTNDVLTILRQDVGDGWWEATDSRGMRGLVPESYLEIVPSFPVNNRVSTAPVKLPATTSKPLPKPSVLPVPKPVLPKKNHGFNNNDGADDWDDDDDDWDDEPENFNSVTPGTPVDNGEYATIGETAGSHSSRHSTSFSFLNFSKTGGEAFLFDTAVVNVPDSEKKMIIIDGPEGLIWKPLDEPFTCSILSPKKEKKFHGIKSFITYQIVPTFSNIQVSRRYKHFDWLQLQLAERFIMLCIPPLPEKQIVGRFEEDFVNARLRQLQLWIDRMCKHPVVAQSDVFQHFLTCTDAKKWTIGKRKAEKDEFSGGRCFFTVQCQNLDSRQADSSIDKFSRFIKNMDESVKQLTGIYEHNVKNHQGSLKREYQKIGTAFSSLAKSFESDDRQVSQGLTRAIEHTGRTYGEIGELFAQQPKNDSLPLLEGLQEYKGILSSFNGSIIVHKAASSKVQEKASKTADSEEMQSVQRRADTIAATVLAEIQHFNQYRVGDFKSYMQLYLNGQIEFFHQIAAKLEEAARQYDHV